MTTSSFLDSIIALSETPAEDLPSSMLNMARDALFDWAAVARAGRDEQVSIILRNMAEREESAGQSSLFGSTRRTAPRAAALANGATSHALDYDDTHFAYVGHPSVAIYPAVLALAEDMDVDIASMIDAYAIGIETACRIGARLGRAHYNKGFHQTATAGAFGATLASARLLGLDTGQRRQAIGLAATRASGLKSQFGTMGKPYNAGLAASNGVEAALLAQAGMTSADDGLMGHQGFFATHLEADDLPADTSWEESGYLALGLMHKYHACCHGTHAMIDALTALRQDHGLAAADVDKVTLRTNPRWMSVCNIPAPRTGLEVKFSYVWLAAMVLENRDTAALTSYADSTARDADLARGADRVTVLADEAISDTAAHVTVTLDNGMSVVAEADIAAPITEEERAERLKAKACAIDNDEVVAKIWQAVSRPADTSARAFGNTLAAR
ncbi:MmgE/PrpD family protein [Alphaproteobacteria bacterium LSUCC0684]